MNYAANGLVNTAQQVSYGQTGYLQQTAAAGEAPPISILEAQVKRLTASAQHIDTLATQLHVLADRHMGQEVAQEGKAGAPVPSPQSSVGKLNEAHEWLEAARNRLANAVQRLERL